MAVRDEKRIVNGKLVVVSLFDGGAEATITVSDLDGKSHSEDVSIQPFLDAGLGSRDALRRLLAIVVKAVSCATM